MLRTGKRSLADHKTHAIPTLVQAFKGSAEIARQDFDQLLRAFVIVMADSNLGRGLRTLDLTEHAEDEYESS